MPYKDPAHKREWELQHRAQRLARRRQLRSVEAARTAAQPGDPEASDHSAGILYPLIAGGVLAAYNPTLAIAAGSLTLLAAAVYRKGRDWWILGASILGLGLFFQWNDSRAEKRKLQNA
jgi:hypothetical protein